MALRAMRQPEAAVRNTADLALIDQVVAGNMSALERFLEAGAPTIWSAVILLEAEGPSAEAAFLRVIDALKADGFRCLKGFDGRATLATFLSLVTRQVLIDALPDAFATAPQQAWRRFDRAFARDIRRRVSRRFPRADQAARDDLFQEVCVRLLEDSFRRLRAFHGKGSFEGFVLVLIDRLLIDLLRKEAPRRRLPAEVERLAPLERAIFVKTAWQGMPMDPALLFDVLRLPFPDKDVAALAAALQNVRAFVEIERARRVTDRAISIDGAAEQGHPLSLCDDAPDPEDQLIRRDDEDLRQALIAAIKSSAEAWPEEERTYLRTFLSSGEPPRVIAQMMARPVEDIRQIQQRVLRKLRQIADTTKSAGMSV